VGPTTTGPPAAPKAADPIPLAAGPPQNASPALKAIYDDLESVRATAAKLDKEARKQKDAHWQETGQARRDLVAALKRLRSETDALTAADVGGDKIALERTRAALYRQEDDLAPYYYQMVNADVLSGNGLAAGGRTCNITSISMTLQALGKTPADYTLPDKAMLPLIAAQFETSLSNAEDRLSQDPDGLRLPDFLQLLAVAKFLDVDPALAQSDPKAFAAAVAKARDKAAGQITNSGWFGELISGWSLTADNVHPFSKSGHPEYEAYIDRIGEINRGAVSSAERDLVKKLNEQEKANKSKKRWSRETLTDEQRAQVRDSVVHYYDVERPDKLKAELDKLTEKRDELKQKIESEGTDSAPPKKHRPTKEERELAGLDKQVKAKQGQLDEETKFAQIGLNKAAGDPRALDAILPIDVYKKFVSAALTQELDAGNQIVGHVYNHFIRVEDVRDDGIVIDDPGAWNRKHYLLSWDEARSLGGFARFTVIKKR
jgi:hypothetical protein